MGSWAVTAMAESRMRVPVMRPRLPSVEAVRERLHAVDESGWYSNFGPQEAALRDRFAAFLDVDPTQVATCANATLGLQGAAVVAPSSAWVVPSFTFLATPTAMIQSGGTVRFADIRADDWRLDVEAACPQIGEGIVPVLPFGSSFRFEDWDPDRDVIVDAAASLGASLPPLRDLPRTWAVVFSLHATKCVPAGEGGLVVFGDPERTRQFRTWTNFGLSRTREATRIGGNAKLSEVAAVYAHASLDEWRQARAEWVVARERARALEERFGLEGQTGVVVSPYWIVDLAERERAARFEAACASRGIGSRRWWARGCHRMPAFASIDRPPLPTTEDVAERTIGLPMFRGMDDRDVEAIASALEAAIVDEAT
jgi:dTDP-4-amino-4,6-dideoxygalactose transaminase